MQQGNVSARTKAKKRIRIAKPGTFAKQTDHRLETGRAAGNRKQRSRRAAFPQKDGRRLSLRRIHKVAPGTPEA
jgi:hypothetical protein